MMNRRRLIWLVIALVLLSVFAFAAFASTSFARPATDTFSEMEFQGVMNFEVEFLENGYSPDMLPCPATAALLYKGSDHYELRLGEHGLCGNRMSIWNIEIDPEGNVSGEAWSQVLAPSLETGTMFGEWWLHTGCKLVGASPAFPGVSGNWDGQVLTAYVDFTGRCQGGTYWSNPDFWTMAGVDIEEDQGRLTDGVTWEDGPVHVRFGAELTTAE